MKKFNDETPFFVKRTYEASISIDENIHEALSLHSLSLYMSFRYEADYSKEGSQVEQFAEHFYKKSKISRAQYYRCMNELEKNGLILRDVDNQLGQKCTIHVARELGYFTSKGVSHRDRGVSHRDTYCKNISINTNTNLNTHLSDADKKTQLTEIKKQQKSSMTVDELLEDNPHEIEKSQIDDWLKNRKSQRAPVTKTAWNRINKVLCKISERGISASEAFEKMVASGWRSLEENYFQSNTVNSTKSGYHTWTDDEIRNA